MRNMFFAVAGVVAVVCASGCVKDVDRGRYAHQEIPGSGVVEGIMESQYVHQGPASDGPVLTYDGHKGAKAYNEYRNSTDATLSGKSKSTGIVIQTSK